MTVAKKSTKPAARKTVHEGDEDLDAFSDKLLADLDEADVPKILQLHQMPRRRRAALVNEVQALLPRTVEMETALKKGTTNADMGMVADFLADIEDLLATIAVEPDRLRAWALDADDMQLLGLFARFVKSFQSGEASSSSR